MPVRPNMQPLIDLLREQGQAADSTETFNGVTYWSDQQLQDILDYVGVRSIVAGSFYEADDTIYIPSVPKSHYADPDTIKVLVDDAWGASSGTWDATKKELTSTEDIEAFSATWISMNAALAQFWERKANQRSDYVNVKGGQNKMDMQQEYDHCVEMMKYYKARIWVRWQP
jgi:hypothetical protein